MNYWNDCYWKKHLEDHKGEKLDFINDLWLDKYREYLEKINKGKCLDLGCGIGQYTKYFRDLGFDVVAADISHEALKKVKEEVPDARILELDMSKDFDIPDNSFDVVFASLSIHYFDTVTTKNILKEIKRILKPNGYFIGAVNSSKTYKFIKDRAVELEPNFYKEGSRTVRLWDSLQFQEFFKDFKIEILEEVTTTRWNKEKIMWEFIVRN